MHALFVTDDLMISSQVGGTAEANGYALEFVRNAAQVLAAIETKQVALVIVDIQVDSLDLTQLVPQLKAASPQSRVIAFGPHVRVELLQAATDAGCDTVMSRGEFTRSLKEIFVSA